MQKIFIGNSVNYIWFGNWNNIGKHLRKRKNKSAHYAAHHFGMNMILRDFKCAQEFLQNVALDCLREKWISLNYVPKKFILSTRGAQENNNLHVAFAHLQPSKNCMDICMYGIPENTHFNRQRFYIKCFKLVWIFI